MNAQKLAQEVVARYKAELNEYATHAENVAKHLRGPVQAVTLFVLRDDGDEEEKLSAAEMAIPPPTNEKDDAQEEKKSAAADWRDYLSKSDSSEDLPDLNQVNMEAYAALGRRTKARLEAFLAGVSLSVTSALGNNSAPVSEVAMNDQRGNNDSVRSSISLDAGLAGFTQGLGLRTPEKLRSSARSLYSKAAEKAAAAKASKEKAVFRRKAPTRSISSQASSTGRLQQISSSNLATRLELYIRSLCRVKAQGQDCVVAAEPPRALKARARAVVDAFVDTVDTVHQQDRILTRLIKVLTQELLAVEVLSERLCKLIRQLVSDYIQSVSFASLAFLSSPETSAEQRLTPKILRFLRYVQSNWRESVADCELERMLSLVIDSEMRYTFKNIEFRSIGHLLEVCQGFRQELRNIEISPDMRIDEPDVTNSDAVRQAIRDLQREIITVNGNILPPVKSRQELISLLSQTLNSRTLTTAPLKSRRKSKRGSSSRNLKDTPDQDYSSSGYDASEASASEREQETAQPGSRVRRDSRRSFRLSTIDFFTKRLLLAASRTGTGGDAYFVVRDLFGGEDVEVVPSEKIHHFGRMGMMSGPATIEITVRLASVTIKCHGSFDVYPKSMVRNCEPLIQVHTTTSETISIHEVRATDSNSEDAIIKDDCADDDSDSEHSSVMVVQERKTERTGWRTLTVRPALYEKYEEFSTPS